MRTKRLLIAGVMLFSVMNIDAQTTSAVESTSETGYGLQNGATGGTSAATGSTFFGYQAGRLTTNSSSGKYNTFMGHQSGRANTTGYNNTFVGYQSGYNHTTTSGNTFLGFRAGFSTTTGRDNTFIGTNAGWNNTSELNTFIGNSAGFNNTVGFWNTYLGHAAGSGNVNGYGNVMLGYGAGQQATGTGNVFIGCRAGQNETQNFKLYIANDETDKPLIYGDFSSKKVGVGGINSFSTSDKFPATASGTSVSSFSLFVKGGILTEEVIIALQSDWADYVFEDNYNLLSLEEVEKFINKNGHLPNVPSSKEIKEKGMELSKITVIQQEKIEELTLYLIEQKKENDKLKQKLEELKNILNTLVNEEK